jgi:hypothetical protein
MLVLCKGLPLQGTIHRNGGVELSSAQSAGQDYVTVIERL